jgi:hypothetical protein
MGNLKSDIIAEHAFTQCTTQLEYPLRNNQIGVFRKFVNTFIGAENDLFHNHKSSTTFHYRYPMVQYKVLDDKAVLMGLAEPGKAAIESLLARPDFRERCTDWIGDQFAVTEVTSDLLALYTTPVHRYKLKQYLALNEHNIREWNEKPALIARAALLERCLAAHILKFASAIRWQLPPKSLQVAVLDFRSYKTRVHDVPFVGFDLFFQTNITLPENVGLGKAASHGYGICNADANIRR